MTLTPHFNTEQLTPSVAATAPVTPTHTALYNTAPTVDTTAQYSAPHHAFEARPYTAPASTGPDLATHWFGRAAPPPPLHSDPAPPWDTPLAALPRPDQDNVTTIASAPTEAELEDPLLFDDSSNCSTSVAELFSDLENCDQSIIDDIDFDVKRDVMDVDTFQNEDMLGGLLERAPFLPLCDDLPMCEDLPADHLLRYNYADCLYGGSPADMDVVRDSQSPSSPSFLDSLLPNADTPDLEPSCDPNSILPDARNLDMNVFMKLLQEAVPEDGGRLGDDGCSVNYSPHFSDEMDPLSELFVSSSGMYDPLSSKASPDMSSTCSPLLSHAGSPLLSFTSSPPLSHTGSPASHTGSPASNTAVDHSPYDPLPSFQVKRSSSPALASQLPRKRVCFPGPEPLQQRPLRAVAPRRPVGRASPNIFVAPPLMVSKTLVRNTSGAALRKSQKFSERMAARTSLDRASERCSSSVLRNLLVSGHDDSAKHYDLSVCPSSSSAATSSCRRGSSPSTSCSPHSYPLDNCPQHTLSSTNKSCDNGSNRNSSSSNSSRRSSSSSRVIFPNTSSIINISGTSPSNEGEAESITVSITDSPCRQSAYLQPKTESPSSPLGSSFPLQNNSGKMGAHRQQEAGGTDKNAELRTAAESPRVLLPYHSLPLLLQRKSNVRLVRLSGQRSGVLRCSGLVRHKDTAPKMVRVQPATYRLVKQAPPPQPAPPRPAAVAQRRRVSQDGLFRGGDGGFRGERVFRGGDNVFSRGGDNVFNRGGDNVFRGGDRFSLGGGDSVSSGYQLAAPYEYLEVLEEGAPSAQLFSDDLLSGQDLLEALEGHH